MIDPATAPALEVLLVEDHAELSESLRAALTARGLLVQHAVDGRAALAMALAEPPDVLVLDLTLPGLDGLHVCRRLRAQADRHIPVLMLTARDTLADKLAGFDAGADDYLIKPFATEELLARIHALAHRRRAGTAHLLQIGSLTIDRRTGHATRAGQPLALRQTAHRILLILAEAWPRAVTRSELIRQLWRDDPPESDPLRTHLYLLRQALDKPFTVPMLETVHDVGVRLRADR
ncbi:MAG: response regulator transcription factor [Gemmatimonadaceae bacterium]|nr:response regulator transcription factor [Gemmatimonadaceae bacterium]